jgi:hypothetical protein
MGDVLCSYVESGCYLHNQHGAAWLSHQFLLTLNSLQAAVAMLLTPATHGTHPPAFLMCLQRPRIALSLTSTC